MDYNKIYKELNIKIKPLAENYNPNNYAKTLIEKSPCYSKAMKYTSTSTGTIIRTSKND